MAVRYYPRWGSATSDLTAPGAFRNTVLDPFGSTVNNDVDNTVAAAGATVQYSFFTRPNDPGIRGQSTGTFIIRHQAASTNGTLIFLSIQLHRINSGGVVQASSEVSAEQDTTTVRTFTIVDPPLGTWNVGDRLRVDYFFRNSSGISLNIDVLFSTLGTINRTIYTPFIQPVAVADSVGTDERTGTENPFTYSSTGSINLQLSGSVFLNTTLGVAVFAIDYSNQTNDITSITYNGQALTLISSSTDTAGEPANMQFYFLSGSNVERSGSIAVNFSTATTDNFVFYTRHIFGEPGYTASIQDVVRIQGDSVNPTASLTFGDNQCTSFAPLYSGQDATNNIIPGINITGVVLDLGQQVVGFYEQSATAAVFTTGSYAYQWNIASDDLAIIAVAFRQDPPPSAPTIQPPGVLGSFNQLGIGTLFSITQNPNLGTFVNIVKT